MDSEEFRQKKKIGLALVGAMLVGVGIATGGEWSGLDWLMDLGIAVALFGGLPIAALVLQDQP